MGALKSIKTLLTFTFLGLVFFANQAIASTKVMVFAAASLTNALTEIGQQYDKTHDTKTVFSFASSSTLARQIQQGAPAQIFLSANQKWMDYLVDNHAVDKSSRKTLLKNTLVLIASKSHRINHITLNRYWNIKSDLNGSRLAVGDPAHVPAGKYAQEALTSLGLWQQAMPLLARANNVRAALVLVERGEAPLGIVYSTDAAVAKGVKIVATFPESSHQPIEYPMALVNNTPSAVAFYDYLQSHAAQSIFIKYGFGVM